MPLVELIRGDRTANETVERMTATLRAMGKRPVLVEKDVPGFVWNRLQLALLREAVWIVEQGVAAPETVDEIVRDGLARRWRLTGPFETVALGGPDTFVRVAANLFPVLSEADAMADLGAWLERDPARLAAIRERRDAGLVEELRRERSEGSDA
jgi:3-hydroxybutyryl-CoA dehydrogenase